MLAGFPDSNPNIYFCFMFRETQRLIHKALKIKNKRNGFYGTV